MERVNLDALEAALAKATSGEIRLLPNGGASLPEDSTYWAILGGPGFYDGPGKGGFDISGFIDEAQAQRIVASYNALPALIAEVRELRQEAERARWCEETRAAVEWSSFREVWVVEVGFWSYFHPDRNAAIDAARGVK